MAHLIPTQPRLVTLGRNPSSPAIDFANPLGDRVDDPEPTGRSWTRTANFEGGTVGQEAQGANGFVDAFSDTLYSTDQAHSGTMSSINSIVQGETGYGSWGGTIALPTQLIKGDEYWFRVWAFFPNGFSFYSGATEGVKFMRTQSVSAGGAHEGYWNWFLDPGGMMAATSVNMSFYNVHQNSEIRQLGGAISTGVWHEFEYYIKLSDIASESIWRCWRDGVLLMEDAGQTAILPTAGSRLGVASVFTYWNNAAPVSQSCYLDDITVTSIQPANQDAAGNYMIGSIPA